MKKILFLMTMSLMASGAFANEVSVKKDTAKDKKKNVSQVCCRRGSTNANGENVTIRACVASTGDYQIDLGNACQKAKKAVEAAMNSLN